jgi:hypothetical protein
VSEKLKNVFSSLHPKHTCQLKKKFISGVTAKRKFNACMVIPMILFVKINKEEAQKVHARKDTQFYGFVSTDRSGRIPAEISNNDIQTLKYMLGASDKPIIFGSSEISRDAVVV